jgi:hypothetical protein
LGTDEADVHSELIEFFTAVPWEIIWDDFVDRPCVDTRRHQTERSATWARRLGITLDAGLLHTLQPRARVQLEWLAGLRELEDLLELVAPLKHIRLAGSPARRDVLDRLGRKNQLHP